MSDYSRNFTLTKAEAVLSDIARRELILPYGNTVETILFNPFSRDGELQPKSVLLPRSRPKYVCDIGTYEMHHNVESDKVRDMDVVWSAKHIFHEAEHMYQFQSLYKLKKPSGRIVDMARMDSIADVIEGYRSSTYNYRLSELDAEYYGIKNTIKYFNENLRNEDGKPIIDVSQCLVDRAKELKQWKGFQVSQVESVDELTNMLQGRRKDYQILGRDIVLTDEDKANPFLQELFQYDPSVENILKSSDKTGVDRDRELLAIAMDINPACGCHYPCMDKEREIVRAMHPTRIPKEKRAEREALARLSRMDYQAGRIEEEFGTIEGNPVATDHGTVEVGR